MRRPRLDVQRVTVLALALGVTLLLPNTAQSQAVVVDPAAGIEPEVGVDVEVGESTPGPTGKTLSPFVAPVPFKNTQLGWGLMLMGGLIHRFDTAAVKPSTGAVGGFYTENGSWGVMLMENARLAGDRWRLRLMGAHPEVRYDFFGIGEDQGEAGRSIQIQQNMNLATLAALRRVTDGVYLGVTALYMGASVSVRDTVEMGPPPAVADTIQTDLFAPGVQGEVDTRDDDYWPIRGTLARLKAWFFAEALGGDRAFQRYLLNWSWYAPLIDERLTIATNLNACGVGGDAPFWTLCSIGMGRGGLRGYQQGRYRDIVMTTEQFELRYHNAGRFGATAFGGFGHVAPTFGDIFTAKVMWAAGLGLRYQLMNKYPMHVRLDYAWGRDGGYLHFGVSEAF